MVRVVLVTPTNIKVNAFTWRIFIYSPFLQDYPYQANFNMRFLYISILSVLTATAAAAPMNTGFLDPVATPDAGKAFYTVYPQQNADHDTTANYIKSVVGEQDLLPWTNTKDQLLSWTIEATSDEAAKVKTSSGVDRVETFVPPAVPASWGTNGQLISAAMNG